MIFFELKNFYMDIITDSHVIGRKNAERFCVPFYIAFSNKLKGDNVSATVVWRTGGLIGRSKGCFC